MNSYLIKLDFFGSIETVGCYFSRHKLSSMGIHKIYGTRHIGHDHVWSLVGLMDFFCFSETPQLGCACLYSTCCPESPSIFCGLYSIHIFPYTQYGNNLEREDFKVTINERFWCEHKTTHINGDYVRM
ncbi:unnamed protein product [Lupinus luteus]|uniref:Uncharacterized protein n=1 Tax=Lupinus luteus TaxID=3873 RepID=A0AAV1WC93_LUPLU